MKPFLSLCMIVKDEEKVLARCLESVHGIVDEIIVVDTGSDDRTKEIAYQFTNLVYDYKWDHDFAKARNFAASKASGEWIIVLDADEYVDRESFYQFKLALKENHNENILAVQIVNFVGANGTSTSINYHDRVYRNDGTIRYYRSIHENLRHIESLEKRGIANLQVFHTGYMDETVKEKKKNERNLQLLKLMKNKEAVDYFYLGNEYMRLNRWDEAIQCYQRGYQLAKNKSVDWVPRLLVNLINCLYSANRKNEAFQVVSACEEAYPDVVDFHFIKGKIYFNDGKRVKAAKIFEDILANNDSWVAYTSLDYLEYLPHKYLGEIYEKENQLQSAVFHYSKSLSVNDADDQTWVRLIGILAKHSQMSELTQFLRNKCLNRSSMTPVRLIKILLDVPNLEVQKLSESFLDESNMGKGIAEALMLKNLFLDGEISMVDQALASKSPNQIVSLLSHDIFHLRDLILLAIEIKNEYYKNVLYNIRVNNKIDNLLDVIFRNNHKKLTLIEEELFISMIRQAHVLKRENLVEYLENKKYCLSHAARKRLNEEIGI